MAALVDCHLLAGDCNLLVGDIISIILSMGLEKGGCIHFLAFL